MITAEKLTAVSDGTEEQAPLPKGWRLVPLENLCSIRGGKRLPTGTDFSPAKTAFPYIRVTDFTNGTVRTSQLKYLHEDTQKLIARYIINRDDVYISIAGSIGIVGAIPDELDGANLTENAARLILKKEKIDRDFLSRYLQSSEGQQQIKHRTNLVGQPKLALERIAKIEIPLPPTIEEQKRIARILDEQMKAVAQARAAVEEQLKASNLLPNALLRSIFESEEAQGWEKRKLGEICDGNGQYGSSDGSVADEKTGIPILRMGNINDGRITWDNMKFIQLPAKEVEKYRLIKGDVIFNRTNSAELVGKTAVFDGSCDAVFASYLIRLRARENIAVPEFIAGFINSKYGRDFIEANMTRAIGQVNISASTIREMIIPIPSLNRQTQIIEKLAAQLQEVETLKKTLTEQFDAINKMPSALLRKAFAGEL